MKLFADDSKGAVFSPCRVYRYKLWRTWGEAPPLAVIGLNPSTADEVEDDPTIRRCIDYAKRWGHGGLVMLNLFALRSTDPRKLREVPDPIGPDNNETLVAETRGRRVFCAWGVHGRLHDRGAYVGALLAAQGDAAGRDLVCLGWTRSGHPKHPLYLPAAAKPVPLFPLGARS